MFSAGGWLRISGVSEDLENSGARPGTAEGAGGDLAPARQIRVGWVAGTRTLERFGRTLRPLAIGLLDEFVRLTAICPEDTDTRQLPIPPIEVVACARRKWWTTTRKAAEPIAQRLRTAKLELLHALDADAAALTERLARILGIGWAVSCYGLDGARRLKKLGDHVAAVFAASVPILEELRRKKVAPPERLLLLRPGVHRVRHANCFNDPQHSISIVTCGVLDDFGAYATVLRSFAELRSRDYDCALFVIGTGPAETKLRALSASLGVHRDLTFADYQPGVQLPGILKAADVYVSPVSRKSLDVQRLLAMAAGVPVLAATGGVGDFLHDAQTALLFAPGDSADLTTKLLGVVDDRAAARNLAEGGLQYLRENHSPTSMVVELAEAYRRMMEAKPQP